MEGGLFDSKWLEKVALEVGPKGVTGIDSFDLKIKTFWSLNYCILKLEAQVPSFRRSQYQASIQTCTQVREQDPL